MKKNTILQMEPLFGDGEKKSLIEYMDSGGWLTEFVKTKELEDLITNFTGSRKNINDPFILFISSL